MKQYIKTGCAVQTRPLKKTTAIISAMGNDLLQNPAVRKLQLWAADVYFPDGVAKESAVRQLMFSAAKEEAISDDVFSSLSEVFQDLHRTTNESQPPLRDLHWTFLNLVRLTRKADVTWPSPRPGGVVDDFHCTGLEIMCKSSLDIADGLIVQSLILNGGGGAESEVTADDVERILKKLVLGKVENMELAIQFYHQVHTPVTLSQKDCVDALITRTEVPATMTVALLALERIRNPGDGEATQSERGDRKVDGEVCGPEGAPPAVESKVVDEGPPESGTKRMADADPSVPTTERVTGGEDAVWGGGSVVMGGEDAVLVLGGLEQRDGEAVDTPAEPGMVADISVDALVTAGTDEPTPEHDADVPTPDREAVDDARTETRPPAASIPPIPIEVVQHILRERYKFGRKKDDEGNLKPLDVHPQHPEWAGTAYQYAEELRRTFKRFPNAAHLSSLPDTLKQLLNTPRRGVEWNPKSYDNVVSALSKLLKLMNQDERETYVGSNFCEVQESVRVVSSAITQMIKDKQTNQQLTATEIQNWISFEKLREKVTQYVTENPPPDKIETEAQMQLVRCLVIISIYVLEHEPRRLEILESRVPRGNESDLIDNIYDQGVFTLNHYKTAYTYKQYRLRVSERTQRLVELLIEYGSRKNWNGYIFGHQNQVLPESSGTAMVQNAFLVSCQKSLSCDILRKIYVRYAFDNGLFSTAVEQNELARKMANSVEILMLVYLKRVPPEVTGDESIYIYSEDESNVSPRSGTGSKRGSPLPPTSPLCRIGTDGSTGGRSPKRRKTEEKTRQRTQRKLASKEQDELLAKAMATIKASGFVAPKGKEYSWEEVKRVEPKLEHVENETLRKWWNRIKNKAGGEADATV